MNTFTLHSNLIDLHNRNIYPAEIYVKDGVISAINTTEESCDTYILPGFIDAHIHIESSMLIPSEFARIAVNHGTVATVSDPHEIANVCGIEGIEYMIDNGKKVNFKFFFGAPSCVPATSFETAGAVLNSEDVKNLLKREDIWYLSEMMNYPGVIHKDEEVLKKITYAHQLNKPVDGHAPGLIGEQAKQYIEAGISTDHECFNLEEALYKINHGMKIIIREGSAARNFEELAPLLKDHPDKIMFCSDDKHPDELLISHIDNLVKRAIEKGYDLYDVLRAACTNPINHYKLPVGQLQIGDSADFIIIDNIEHFNILATYINGEKVSENKCSLIERVNERQINQFKAEPINVEQIRISANDSKKIRIIEALDGQLITNEITADPKTQDGYIVSDTSNDILKLVVINRYDASAKPAVAFIKNIGLKEGAFASTIAHDCHNIIATGTSDGAICEAINALIVTKGGISITDADIVTSVLSLPIAGLMSDNDGISVAEQYIELDKKVKSLGCTLASPYMTLSFMALLVIPSLKLSDKGLFNGKDFSFSSVTL